MKKTTLILALALGATMSLTTSASAQNKFTVNGNLDLVTNYVWRGMDQNSGVSAQPGLGLAYKGFSLSAWGSQSLTNNENRDVQEFDINLSYSIGGFSATITDYWWAGLHNPYGYYKNGPVDNPVDGGHHFEATVSYTFDEKLPLTLCWSTWFAGADLRTSGNNRCYSTYISASYDIACYADITLTPAIGITPWKGYYHDKTAFTDISLKASKSLALSDKISMPLFVQAIASPINDHVYLVAGLGVSL